MMWVPVLLHMKSRGPATASQSQLRASVCGHVMALLPLLHASRLLKPAVAPCGPREASFLGSPAR